MPNLACGRVGMGTGGEEEDDGLGDLMISLDLYGLWLNDQRIGGVPIETIGRTVLSLEGWLDGGSELDTMMARRRSVHRVS